MAPVINQSDPDLEKERSFKLKKYGIISVAVVVGVACLVGGMLGGMHYLHTSTKDMSEMVTAYRQTFKDRDGKTAKEKIQYDLKNNVTETTVKKNDSEFKILNDFKRGISVTRTSSKDGAVCYVSTLSKDATEMHPETFEQYKKQHPNPDVIEDEPSANEAENRFFQVADKPMSDITFLGKKVQEMCKGLKTYWLFPSDEMPPAGMNGTLGGEGDEEAEADGTVGKRNVRASDRCNPCPRIIKIFFTWWYRYSCTRYCCVLTCHYRRIWCIWLRPRVRGRIMPTRRCIVLRKSTTRRIRP